MELKKEKCFKSAPLPFQGQKRRFAGAFSLILKQIKEKRDIKVTVDLFGGSGLLSYTAKRILPHCKVVYNDFDNYSKRLHHIGKTNALLSDIRQIVAGLPKEKKLDEQNKTTILKRIEYEEKSGYVDYITLSASLLFSSNYELSFEGLRKEQFYNNVRASDYDFDPDEYLKGLDVVCMDYKELYLLYKDIPGVLFIVDPPYLSTDTKTYGSDKFWKLRDYLDVLNVLIGSDYVFFTSNKSRLLELCEWFDDNRLVGNPFKNSVLNTQNITLNKTSSYTDMMLCRFVE